MGINLYVANDLNEAAKSKEYIEITEEIFNYLVKNKNNFPEAINLITELDPYNDKIYSEQEIKDLLGLTLEFKAIDKGNEIGKFMLELKKLCESALSQGKLIIAVGD
ncbi:hypothetical protein [Thermospira aquatica]|uniref:Uncharacterized protein n=1 Tax=Thermospira aquatica TaxID=2828656 RepID=A0AAX3BED6_9SPIR|nr:hypothetical protein [Thermospira aquatica]URA10624.1 hypothetical protein KDW03_02125 [Thermospira aquatica]